MRPVAPSRNISATTSRPDCSARARDPENDYRTYTDRDVRTP